MIIDLTREEVCVTVFGLVGWEESCFEAGSIIHRRLVQPLSEYTLYKWWIDYVSVCRKKR